MLRFSSSHHSLLNEYSYRFLNGSQAIPERMMVRGAKSASQEEASDEKVDDDYYNIYNNLQQGSWLHYQLPVTHLKQLQKDCTLLRHFSKDEVTANF